jgi:hypothetical protein
LLVLGAGVLVYRTVTMLTDGSATVLVPWVAATIWIELALDGAAMLAAGGWAWTGRAAHERAALWLAAIVTVVHALRVLVFVLGRTVWIDFDVRPEHRLDDRERWTWFGVWFAASMSAASLGVMAMIVWLRRRIRHGHVKPGGAPLA